MRTNALIGKTSCMRSQLAIRKHSRTLFAAYGLSILLCVLTAIYTEQVALLLLPAALAVGFQVLVDYEKIYFLLFLMLPLSTEVFITDHLATDLPTEPLIVGLMLIYFLIVLSRPLSIDSKFVRHPLSVLLLLHLGWTVVTTFTSASIGFSSKFLLAKLWYIVTFFYLAGHILRHPDRVKFILWLVALPLTLATLKVILSHATLGFAFTEINAACPPFFRNHVNYAAMLSVFLPFLWYLRKWSSNDWWKRLTEVMIVVLLFGVVTAYTRAAYVALVLALGAFWVFRLGLVRLGAVIATIALIGTLSFLLVENRFMELVPTDQTVAHTELSDIVSSTSELKDVSTMERYYRWIAGAQMVAEKPVFGFGPGNFYHFYKQYTLSRFSTYVSNNPEKSGVHNYYLMVTLEQGIIGLIFFMLLIYATLLYGERVYFKCRETHPEWADLVMAALLSTLVIDAFLVMNDMIETDKIGSFFFFNIAIIAIVDRYYDNELAASEEDA